MTIFIFKELDSEISKSGEPRNSAINKSISIPSMIKTHDDLSEYSFAKYAATYFSGNQSHQFSKKQLKSSLLDLILPADQIAAQVS